MIVNSNYTWYISYYNFFFMLKKQRFIFSKHGVLFFPIFNRKVFYFFLPGRFLFQSKRGKNINRTIWFAASVSRTTFFFIFPFYSNSITCYSL